MYFSSYSASNKLINLPISKIKINYKEYILSYLGYYSQQNARKYALEHQANHWSQESTQTDHWTSSQND